MGRWLNAVETAEQAPEAPVTKACAGPKCEAASNPDVLLMVKCCERWPERIEEWLDVDWSNPVEVGTRVFGCRITRVADA